MERADVADHGLDGERGEGLREEREKVRVVQRNRCHRGRDGGPVDEAKSLLGAHDNLVNPVQLERLGSSHNPRLARAGPCKVSRRTFAPLAARRLTCG